MPPSQLKQLKSSLRESGVLGPQQSKKQKRQNAKTGAAAQNRVQRNAALQAIRDRFNPFEIKTTATKRKFDVTTRDSGSNTAATRARPGVTKSLGEEKRRQTLLQEMNRRNKVGGIHDRRFGEDDPNMTPEEKAAERFARESQKKMRKDSMFNLEDDDDDEEFQLTHMGQTLSFGEGMHLDDFAERDLEDDDSDSEMFKKRKRIPGDEEFEETEGNGDSGEDGEELPERKKSKHEVMKEVIAKSKFYKHERQQAKEDDDDLREELDKDLPDLFDMLRGVKPPPKKETLTEDIAGMNPERAALLGTDSKQDMEREYDQRLKQLTFDKRSQPTDRTKTAEEKALEEAQRLKALEEERVRRMRGEVSSEEEDNGDNDDNEGSDMSEGDSIPDDALAFGLQQSAGETSSRPELGVEDEDDFIIDDDLVETRSDASLSIGDSDIGEGFSGGEEEEEEEEDAQEDDLINGLNIPGLKSGEDATTATANAVLDSDGLPYTFTCPGSHDEFIEIICNIEEVHLPTVIQRIRALHHHRLHSDNKVKLSRFAAILVEHVAWMADQVRNPAFAIVENILRHIHSLAKVHPESVSQAFRAQLRQMAAERPLNLLPQDLVILTGIATIFPTSDHFHAIATPAHLCLARYLGQGAVNTLTDFATGTYAASLFLQYQTRSKRYMPEFMNFVLNTLCHLAPTEPKSITLGYFPSRTPSESLRLQPSKKLILRKLRFWDVAEDKSQINPQAQEELKLSLITTLVGLLSAASDLWVENHAYSEIFGPAQNVLRHFSQSCKGKAPSSVNHTIQLALDKLEVGLDKAHQTRRPLLLHNHRPLAIKSAIPKFEETFNPDKHYDPNRERAELNRLKTEFKRERKGAMRELRKDANFIAREQLREKKERDAEYEKKYKRLVAEVQNEEGREANAYERERRMRKGGR